MVNRIVSLISLSVFSLLVYSNARISVCWFYILQLYYIHWLALVIFLLTNVWESLASIFREGNGNPLQYSCLESPMDGGAWWAAVHGVTKSRKRLNNFIFNFHFHALEKEMATHSSVLAWRIPGKAEPGGLSSMGSHRVGHNWSDLAAAAATKSLCWCSNPSALECGGFRGRTLLSYKETRLGNRDGLYHDQTFGIVWSNQLPIKLIQLCQV